MGDAWPIVMQATGLFQACGGGGDPLGRVSHDVRVRRQHRHLSWSVVDANISVMSLAFYHIAHLIGLIFVFIGFGALLSSESSRSAMKWHGLGLLISAISGFGMLAKLQIFQSMPTWVWIKIGLWLVLGFLPVLARRRVVAAPVVVVLAVLIGGVMGYLGYLKPAF